MIERNKDDYVIRLGEDSLGEIIRKIINLISVGIGSWIGRILANGILIAIGLWLCHNLGYLITITFSWQLAIVVSIAQQLIKNCFRINTGSAF